MSEYSEFITFLNDPLPHVRKIAVQNLKGLTTNHEVREALSSTDVVHRLLRLLGDSDNIAQDALTCLINLAEEAVLRKTMFERSAVLRAAENILDPDYKLQQLTTILLSNLTIDQEGAKKLVDARGGVILKQLFRRVLQGKSVTSDVDIWLANVMQNTTQLQEAQLILLEDLNLFQNLFEEVFQSNLVRRRAILGTIRNCLFIQEKHSELLSTFNLIFYLTAPLSGPRSLIQHAKESQLLSFLTNRINVENEKDPICKSIILDCFMLLTAQLEIRIKLRTIEFLYPAIRDLHKDETNDSIKEVCEQLVNVLVLGDEETTQESQSTELVQK
eukprot:TRINITY_DN723_c2_g1_i1.p1 TRINITY_DN723_c2_g1~~TRINITY_DN723_c2_g1_i1.p1  ORF type:complete len:330 (-),score=133.79 TRINITY_DN723_c2_g1_i1:101-1090(-)